MIDREVLEFYSNHNVKSTLKKFDITYRELKEICAKEGFVKSQEQIRETYYTTRIEKYGSIKAFRAARRNNIEKNSFNR